MDIHERMLCIKYINPKARCAVWNDEPGGRVVYDEICHVGKKPTLEECETVLSLVREQTANKLTSEGLQTANEEKIRAKIRELAITSLGEALPKDYV